MTPPPLLTDLEEDEEKDLKKLGGWVDSDGVIFRAPVELIRWASNIRPTHHIIRQILAESPLCQLIIWQSHRLIGCNLGTDSYVSHIRMTEWMLPAR